MLIDITEGKMRAADGTRYQQADMGSFPVDIQIPIGAVDDLMKLLRSTDQNTIGVGETDSALVFQINNDLFIAQKLNAAFPDVDELLLKPALGNDQELHVDRDELIAAIKRVRVTADAETSAIILELKSGVMSVKSRDKFGNYAEETLDVAWNSPDRDVAVNHAYLTDMLQMTDAKSCRFFLGVDSKTRKSPLMLKDDEAGQIGILNQMRAEFLS
jgi:DNA polymerase-3 subunit beta